MMGVGGEEAPCVPWANIKVIQKDPDRICPRFELFEGQAPAGELALAASRIGTDHALWHKLFDMHAEGLEREERRGLLYTVMTVLSDEGVAARIKQQREKATAAAAPKKKRRRR